MWSLWERLRQIHLYRLLDRCLCPQFSVPRKCHVQGSAIEFPRNSRTARLCWTGDGTSPTPAVRAGRGTGWCVPQRRRRSVRGGGRPASLCGNRPTRCCDTTPQTEKSPATRLYSTLLPVLPAARYDKFTLEISAAYTSVPWSNLNKQFKYT